MLQWMAFVDDCLNDPQRGYMVVLRFQMEKLVPLFEPTGVYVSMRIRWTIPNPITTIWIKLTLKLTIFG